MVTIFELKDHPDRGPKHGNYTYECEITGTGWAVESHRIYLWCFERFGYPGEGAWDAEDTYFWINGADRLFEFKMRWV